MGLLQAPASGDRRDHLLQHLPLKIWAVIGTFVSLSALAYGLFVILKTLIFGADAGFPSLMVAILFFSGIQLVGLGIIGEYLGHVFSRVTPPALFRARASASTPS